MVKECYEFFTGVPGAGNGATGFEPRFTQRAILEMYLRGGDLAVHGPRSLGKTALLANLALFLASHKPDTTVVVGASSYMQLREFLFPEIEYWAQQSIEDPFAASIKFSSCRELSRRLENESRIVTLHDYISTREERGSRVFVLLDEPKAMSEEDYYAAHRLRGPVLAIGTPGTPEGPWAEDCQDTFNSLHITFPMVAAAIEDRGDAEKYLKWVDERARQWGVESPLYRNTVLGEFA